MLLNDNKSSENFVLKATLFQLEDCVLWPAVGYLKLFRPIFTSLVQFDITYLYFSLHCT